MRPLTKYDIGFCSLVFHQVHIIKIPNGDANRRVGFLYNLGLILRANECSVLIVRMGIVDCIEGVARNVAGYTCASEVSIGP